MLKTSFIPYKLIFRFDAGTSRGVLKEKTSWIIKIWHDNRPDVCGLGECGPLPGLSPDFKPYLRKKISKVLQSISKWADVPEAEEIGEMVNSIIPSYLPALSFAIETALTDLASGGKRLIVDNDFARGKKTIPINGLIWMGDKDFMLKQIRKKLEEGYDCIKIKIGAINMQAELELLKFIRRNYSPEAVTIRLDANGAFEAENTLKILEKLSAYGIHSIEQPIRAGQRREMKRICQYSPIPVALDEELIGITGQEQKRILLEDIHPQYIILKPTLLGGLSAAGQWINLAEQMGMGWWVTSALESNIGLNAIAQFTAGYPTDLHQGLGTGQLYHNNINSPLYIAQGHLGYDPAAQWDLSMLTL